MAKHPSGPRLPGFRPLGPVVSGVQRVQHAEDFVVGREIRHALAEVGISNDAFLVNDDDGWHPARLRQDDFLVELFRNPLGLVEVDRDLAIIAFLSKLLGTLLVINEDRDKLRVAFSEFFPVRIEMADVRLAIRSVFTSQEHND